MLELSADIEFQRDCAPFLVKLDDTFSPPNDELKVCIPERVEVGQAGDITCDVGGDVLRVAGIPGDDLRGDVLLCRPRQGDAQRLIRRNSQHNTILFTERCDQLCAMCSQPPKSRDYSPMFPFYRNAILLADQGARIGISGGEPTLYLPELIAILEAVASSRRDLSLHILSNGQHFTPQFERQLKSLHADLDILWGIPLYSHIAARHDEIVGKLGAFEPLLNNFYRLGASGAAIELRTVLTARNVMDLPYLANFIATHLPFISYWAIMAMEPIGYAKANKDELFFDHSVFSEPITSAITIANTKGTEVKLFNFPLCTLPPKFQSYCNQSISDWKRKYLDVCEPCLKRDTCTGFFEWYNAEWAWEGVSPILELQS
jgi:His-Xaa-Ser system radical SAM maturase HxsC